MIHTEIYEPRISDYNQHGILSLESMLNIAENAGSHHAAKVNDDVLEGSQHGIAWIIAEWNVKINKLPAYGKYLHISTWVRNESTSATTTVRDIVIKNDNDEICVLLCPKFVLLDLNTQRLIKITPELLERYKPENTACIPISTTRLKEPSSYESEIKLYLRRTDMDFNRHLHNARYISLALEALPQEIFNLYCFSGFRITYRTPLISNQFAIARCHIVENVATIGIYNENNTLCTLIEFYL